MRLQLLSACLALGLSSVVQAALIDRGGGMIYDDVLDITWLQDAGMGGHLNWDDAITWADDLTFGGFDDWRLPSMDRNLDEVIVDCRTANEMDCRDHEMGYMYYHNLGGTFPDDLTGNQTVGDVTLLNIYRDHWSGTEYAPSPLNAWLFFFIIGGQNPDDKLNVNAAWAVRPGDVAVADTDADGVLDNVDNCIEIANADQRDTDADDIGNACDPDIVLPNDCVVNFLDLGPMRTAFLATPGDANWNPEADLNGDDAVNALDLGIMKASFYAPPGPSGIPNTCDGS